jgi:hypothetical protein
MAQVGVLGVIAIAVGLVTLIAQREGSGSDVRLPRIAHIRGSGKLGGPPRCALYAAPRALATDEEQPRLTRRDEHGHQHELEEL